MFLFFLNNKFFIFKNIKNILLGAMSNGGDDDAKRILWTNKTTMQAATNRMRRVVTKKSTY